jgi:hypothetical protein
MNISYGEIVGTSFRLAWKHKSLWLLGLFAAGGTAVSGPNFQFGDTDFTSGSFDPAGVVSFVQQHPEILVFVIGFGLLFALTMLVLNVICKGAMIDAINKLTRGGVYRFGDSFGEGVRFFWRLLLIGILFTLSIVALVMVIVIPIVLSFIIAVPLGIIVLMIGLPLAFMGFAIINNIFALAARAAIVRDSDIGAALEEGYSLLRMYFWPNVIVFLIYLGLSILISIGTLIIFSVLSIPFVLIAMQSTTAFVVSLIIGVPLFLLVSLPLSGFLGAAFESIYTLFYFRLVEPAGRPEPPSPPQASEGSF